MARPIGTLGSVDNLIVGGRTFTDTTNLIILSTYVGNSNAHATLRKISGSSGYAVTSGKTLTIGAVKAVAYDTTIVNKYGLLQSDNDVGLDAATAFTNPVYEYGDSSSRAHRVDQPNVQAVAEDFTAFPIAATKFCSVATIATSASFILKACGYEA